jgi:hypothetical protein
MLSLSSGKIITNNTAQSVLGLLALQELLGRGHTRKLATSTQPQFPRIAISLSSTHVTEWSSTTQFPQFALLHSVTCVQLGLIAILGNCGCVTVASFLGVPSSLALSVTNLRHLLPVGLYLQSSFRFRVYFPEGLVMSDDNFIIIVVLISASLSWCLTSSSHLWCPSSIPRMRWGFTFGHVI